MKRTTNIFKIISLVLCFILLTPVLSFGCSNSGNNANNSYVKINNNVEKIVDAGSSNYKIVIPNNPSECNQYAAEELQLFVSECTGVELTIVEEKDILYSSKSKIISLGSTNALASYKHDFKLDTLDLDGFCIQSFDTSIFICGRTDRATLYGVYEFLERILNVKFIASDCTVTPKVNSLSFYDIKLRENPDFTYRGVLTRATNRSDADVAFYARTRQSHEHIVVDEKYGGSMSWYKGINVVHNTLQYVPIREYYSTPTQKEENSSMYYIKDGKPYDLCWTNGITEDGKIDESIKTSTIKVAIESLKNFIKQDPNAEFYPFGQEDHRDGFCTCANCNSMAAIYEESGVIIRFVNCLINEVQKWVDSTDEYKGKTVKIIMFAYLYSIDAPVVINNQTDKFELIDQTVKPDGNVYIRIAPIDQTDYYALSDPKQSKKIYNTLMQKWGDITDNLMTWIYGSDWVHVFVYSPTIQKMSRELKDFYDAGLDYVFIQLDHFEFNDVQAIMNNYVYTKMLWDIERNPYEVRAEFIKYYFGPANEIIENVYQFMDEYYLENTIEYGGTFIDSRSYYRYHPIEYLEFLSNECERAIQLILQSDLSQAEKDEYQKRIERVKLTPLYLRVINSDNYYMGKEQLKNQTIKEFHLLCEKLNVTNLGEKVFYNEWKNEYTYVE